MTPAAARRLRLGAAALAFALWVGYLGYLAFTARNPVVLSHSQFLVADVVVVARVEDRAAGKVKVEQVVRPKENTPLAAGQEITVANLAGSEGWAGTDDYILPLSAAGGHYQVVRVPRTPGYPRRPWELTNPRIYPATPDTLRQLGELPEAQR